MPDFKDRPDFKDGPEFTEDFRDQLLDLFRWRRDVRRFRKQPLDGAAIDRLIDAACLSPSVGNSQPWRFVRVDETARRAAVRAEFERCNEKALGGYDGERAAKYAALKLAGLDEAPLHLAVFVDHGTAAGHGLGRQTMPETFAYSVVAAVHTLWLAARAEGIGVGWLSILDAEKVAGILDVPADWRLIAYLCVGYPQEEHLDPELERHGWQAPDPNARKLLNL